MRHPTLDRRTLMGAAGATFACVAFSGPEIARAGISGEAGTEPLTGALVGWLVIQPDGAGHLNLVEFDTQSGSARQVAAEVIRHAPSLAIAAQRASDAAISVVARSWMVQPTDCSCEWGRIEHLQSKRSIPFKIWTDFA